MKTNHRKVQIVAKGWYKGVILGEQEVDIKVSRAFGVDTGSRQWADPNGSAVVVGERGRNKSCLRESMQIERSRRK